MQVPTKLLQMKKITLLLFLLFIQQIGIAQKSKNSKFLTKGIWELHTVDGEAAKARDLISLQFNKNGILSITELRDDKQNNGKWNLIDDGKKFRLNLEIDGPFYVDIIAISKKSMTLDRAGSIAIFSNSKSPKTKAKTSGQGKKLVGSWIINTIDNKNVEADNDILQFNADGTVWSNKFNYEAKWEIKDNKLITKSKYKEEIVAFKISKDKKTLTIIERNSEIILVRTNEKLKKPLPSDKHQDDSDLEIFIDDETETETEIVDNFPIDDETETEIVETISQNDLYGKWKVIALDNDTVEERTLVFELGDDMQFRVKEDDSLTRNGSWELKKGRLFLKDSNKNKNDYIVKFLGKGQLELTDYYGKISLKKI